jgi:hypothetical protein
VGGSDHEPSVSTMVADRVESAGVWRYANAGNGGGTRDRLDGSMVTASRGRRRGGASA